MKIIKSIYSYIFLSLFALVMYFYIRKQKEKRVSVDEKADAVITGVQNGNVFKNIALKVAQDLGTYYPAYDPRHWTENDDEVYLAIKNLTHSELLIIASLYNKVYASGKDFFSDLASLLDKKLYNKLTNLI